MSPRDWLLRLQDIRDAMATVIEYASPLDFAAFLADDRTKDAILFKFIIIGEAAQHIPEAIRDRAPNIPWRLLTDMRNFMAHHYWGVEMSTIWETIQEDLPPCLSAINTLLADLGEHPPEAPTL